MAELERVSQEAMSLDKHDRAELASRLIESLEKDRIEQAWIEVAERRYNELKEGRAISYPASEVLERARKIANGEA